MKHRLFARFAVAGCALILSLLMMEGAVRLLPYFGVNTMAAVMRPDPVLDHSLRPNSVGRMKSREYDVIYHINSLGLRDDEIMPRSPGVSRILLLGDSFMEGYGVDRGAVLADQLEALAAAEGRRLDVVNAGVKSYSPLLEYLYLLHHGLALRPDTVLLFFDLSDPANDIYYSRRLISDSEGRPYAIKPRRNPLPLPTSVAHLLERYSVLYANALHIGMKMFPGPAEDIGYAGAALNMPPLIAADDRIPDTEYFPLWDTTLVYLTDIRDMLAERHIDFVLITYPYGHEVAAEAWKVGRVAHGFPPGVSSDRPFRFLENWARSESIPVISLDRFFKADLPGRPNRPFHAATNPERFYFTYDGHWTSAGHAFAAETVYRELRLFNGPSKASPG